jgi:hypothetical protein
MAALELLWFFDSSGEHNKPPPAKVANTGQYFDDS